MRLTHHELNGFADTLSGSSFRLNARPDWTDDRDIPLGLYELPRRSGDAHLYRLNHPLGEAIVGRARSRVLTPAEVVFDYSNHPGKITILEPICGQSGWLQASLLTVDALDQAEDHIMLAAETDNGQPLGEEACFRLLFLNGRNNGAISASTDAVIRLEASLEQQRKAIQRVIRERNARFFEAEADKLDGWAEDLKVGLEREIKEIDRQIKEVRRATTGAVALEEKLAGQKQIKSLEATRSTKRRSLFDAQDEIDRQRAQLIEHIEAKLEHKAQVSELFTIHWQRLIPLTPGLRNMVTCGAPWHKNK